MISSLTRWSVLEHLYGRCKRITRNNRDQAGARGFIIISGNYFRTALTGLSKHRQAAAIWPGTIQFYLAVSNRKASSLGIKSIYSRIVDSFVGAISATSFDGSPAFMRRVNAE